MSLPVHHKFAKITQLAADALPKMRDPASGLLCHKVTLNGQGYQPYGANALYSAMTLVGWYSRGGDPPPWLDDVLDRTVEHALRTSSTSLLGTLLWSLALAEDTRVDQMLERIGHVVDPRVASSMDNGLVLAGLVTVVARMPRLRDLAARATGAFVDELCSRFRKEAQLFAGARRWTPARGPHGVRGALNNGFTSFASQVYPLHGLALYCGEIRGSALPLFNRVAERLITSQGSKGQWWWQYSRRSGVVIEPYPVYSVHQDGMAFMALAPLQELGVGRYEDQLWRGLDWLFGNNELGHSLVNDDLQIIWRCIQRRGSDPDHLGGISPLNHARVLVRAALGRGEVQPERVAADRLEVLHECRPYHLGWILYAASLVTDWPAASTG